MPILHEACIPYALVPGGELFGYSLEFSRGRGALALDEDEDQATPVSFTEPATPSGIYRFAIPTAACQATCQTGRHRQLAVLRLMVVLIEPHFGAYPASIGATLENEGCCTLPGRGLVPPRLAPIRLLCRLKDLCLDPRIWRGVGMRMGAAS